jgi:hypothetical protein
MVGCTDGRVQRKLHGLLAHLASSTSPWCLERGSGLWMDVADVPQMSLSFRCVLWGQDAGGGRRRVMYPLRGNLPIGVEWAEEIMRTPAQLVLDSAHFFPLDELGLVSPRLLEDLRLACGQAASDARLSADSGLFPAVPTTVGPLVGSWVLGMEDLAPQGMAEAPRVAGRKWKDSRIDDWVVRKAGTPKVWRSRIGDDIDGYAGVVRRRSGVGTGDGRKKRRDGRSWPPGAEAEPPD